MKTVLIVFGLLIIDYFIGMALSRGMAAVIFPIMVLLFAAEMSIWAFTIKQRRHSQK